jgi:hypothetical protein
LVIFIPDRRDGGVCAAAASGVAAITLKNPLRFMERFYTVLAGASLPLLG